MFFSGTCIAAVLNSNKIYKVKVKVKCGYEAQIHFVSHVHWETSVFHCMKAKVYIYILMIS